MRGREGGRVLLCGGKGIGRYGLEGYDCEYDKVKECGYGGVKGHGREWGVGEVVEEKEHLMPEPSRRFIHFFWRKDKILLHP